MAITHQLKSFKYQSEPRPLTWFGSIIILINDLFRNFVILLKRRVIFHKVRTKNLSLEEYNDQAWRKALKARNWQSYSEGEGLVTQSNLNGKIGIVLLNGQLYKSDLHVYYKKRANILRTLIKQYADKQDHIVELGCGVGSIMLLLALDGWRVQGFDISENAIRSVRLISAKFKLPMTADIIDLTDPGHPSFSQLYGKVCYTHFTLEQLHRYMDKVVDNIIAARPRRVIHIEPTREILGWNLIDFNEWIYSYAMDYPSSLISELVKQQKEDRIKIVTVKKLGHAPTPRHFPALVVWEVI